MSFTRSLIKASQEIAPEKISKMPIFLNLKTLMIRWSKSSQDKIISKISEKKYS